MMDNTHTIILVLLLVIVTAAFYMYCRKKGCKKCGKSCGMTNWPFLGMLPGVLANANRIHDFATEILQHNGSTFLLRGPPFANMEMLITCDPANTHYILTKNFSNFQKGPDFKKIFDVLGDGIFTAESESWENQRKMVRSLTNHVGFNNFVASISWEKLETGLIPILQLGSEMGIELDLQELFQRYAFDCSCIVVLGHDPMSLCSELPDLPYLKAFSDAEEAILYRHLFPEFAWKLQRFLRIGKERKLSEAKVVVDRFLSHCLSLKLQNIDDGCGINTQDLLTCYIKAGGLMGKSELLAPNISEELWKDTLLNLIFAGKDTISATLTWFFWLLATNPQEEKKIRNEILNSQQTWRYANLEELKKLSYLHGALCETLRLYPPVAIQHKAPLRCDVLPSGQEIQPDAKTILSFYSMGRMESIWGEDCLEFKPERWISDTGRVKNEPSFKFTAFNAGPRSCLGKEMSFIQMKIVAARIISRFEIRVVEGHQVFPSTSVILHMKYGLKVEVSDYRTNG